MPKHDDHLTGLMRISMTPDLERAFKARARQLKINSGDLARLALAAVAENGITIGQSKVDSEKVIRKRGLST